MDLVYKNSKNTMIIIMIIECITVHSICVVFTITNMIRSIRTQFCWIIVFFRQSTLPTNHI